MELDILDDSPIQLWQWNGTEWTTYASVYTKAEIDLIVSNLESQIADLPSDYSKIVYVNNTSPSTATIFDILNPPVTNDNLLKNDVNNLYIGTDASTWVYITSPAGYITKIISNLSNFYLEGTTIDAGSNKVATIQRPGGAIFGGALTASNLSGSNTGDQDLSGKENTANKQNSLAVDGTGVKYTTVDAVRIHSTSISNPHSVTKTQVGLSNVTNDAQIPLSLKGVANGVAELDANGFVKNTQLPSYIDDVLEGYLSSNVFYSNIGLTTVIPAESGKIYIDITSNKTYRWGGTVYVVISETLTISQVKLDTEIASAISLKHAAVTIGTANGLSLSGQQLSLLLASTSVNGALSSTDWNIFNNKQPAGAYLTSAVTTLSFGTTGLTPSTPTAGAIVVGGALAVANGGTGATTAANALTNLGAYPASNPSSYTANLGTVTSVAMTVPTGLTIVGSPITSSGTLALSLTTGYSIPTTANQTNWTTAYTNRITSLTTTGSSGASTLISNVLNVPNYTLAGLGGAPATGSANYIQNQSASAQTASMWISGVSNVSQQIIGTIGAIGTKIPLIINSNSGANALQIFGRTDNLGYIQFFNYDRTTVNGTINGSTNGLNFTGAATFASSVTAPTFIGALTGNATTATTLQTERLINGVSFNGSANITVADATKLPLAGGTLTGALNGTSAIFSSSVQVGNNTAAASASNAGAQRYRVSGNNSYVDVCMQVGASSYEWVNVVQNNW